MQADASATSLLSTTGQELGEVKKLSEATLSLVNKSVDAVHNLKYLNIAKLEDALGRAKEKNKKLLEKAHTLHSPYSLSFHFGMLILMSSLTKAPLVSVALMIFTVVEDKEKASKDIVESLEILGRELTHPTQSGEGIGFQTVLPTVAKKILVSHYKIVNSQPKTGGNYQSLRDSIQNEENNKTSAIQETTENPSVIKKGETLASIIKEILSTKNMLASYSDVEYEKFISTSIDQILQDQKRYNLTGATRQELLTGTSVDRDEIGKLLTSLEAKIAQGETFATSKTTQETAIPTPEQSKVYSGIADPSVSDVVASWRDTIHQDFLTESFRTVIKKVCGINDTTNLESVFIKYCDMPVSKLTETIKSETPDIQKEVLAFLTWVRKSYLSAQKPDIFEKLPFYSVIEAVARGVNSTMTQSGSSSNVKIVLK